MSHSFEHIFVGDSDKLLFEEIYPSIRNNASPLYRSNTIYKRELLMLEVLIIFFKKNIIKDEDYKIMFDILKHGDIDYIVCILDIVPQEMFTKYDILMSDNKNNTIKDINMIQEELLSLIILKYNNKTLQNDKLIKNCLKNMLECFILDENISLIYGDNVENTFLGRIPMPLWIFCEEFSELILLAFGEDYKFMSMYNEDKKKSLCKIDGRILRFIKNPTKQDYINSLKSRRPYEASKLIPKEEFRDEKLVQIALTQYLRTFEVIPHEYISQNVVDSSFINGMKYFEEPLKHIPFIPEKFISGIIIYVKNQLEKKENEEKQVKPQKRVYDVSFLDGCITKKPKM